jgi:energy-coupling factor transport system permease protein
VAALRLFFGQLLALLVGAVRRATRLATAMEARGFGSRACRTIARPQRMRGRDWILLALAAALGVIAVVTSLTVGTWRFLLG